MAASGLAQNGLCVSSPSESGVALKAAKTTITNLESMLIDTIPCMYILQALAAKRLNKIVTSLCLPELEEGKYDSYFPLLSGDGGRKIRALFPFVFPRWKKGIKILTSLCLPELEEGK